MNLGTGIEKLSYQIRLGNKFVEILVKFSGGGGPLVLPICLDRPSLGREILLSLEFLIIVKRGKKLP